MTRFFFCDCETGTRFSRSPLFQHDHNFFSHFSSLSFAFSFFLFLFLSFLAGFSVSSDFFSFLFSLVRFFVIFFPPCMHSISQYGVLSFSADGYRKNGNSAVPVLFLRFNDFLNDNAQCFDKEEITSCQQET